MLRFAPVHLCQYVNVVKCSFWHLRVFSLVKPMFVNLRSWNFFIVRNCSFLMGIIFCSCVALVWTFNTRSVYDFITKEQNIPVNLVLLFNDVSFLFCRFLKSGVMNELKILLLWKSKKVRVIYSKQDNVAAHKTLVWSTYVWRTATAAIFSKIE